MENYGTIRIKLDELIRKAGISKNKLALFSCAGGKRKHHNES